MFQKDIHYSLDLEAEILGACLLETTAFSRVFGLLSAENYYSSDHQKVFEIISEMFDKNLPVSLQSVYDYTFRQKGIESLNQTNTAYYLTRLTTKVVSTANLEYYSVILKQMWTAREIIKLTSSGIKSLNVRSEIINLQARLTELNSTGYTSDWKDMDELMAGLYAHQDEMAKTQGQGLLTGFPTIDRVYGGFFKGQMIVVGARPSVGKSAFAGQMAMNMARNGNRVGFISLEMNNNEIAGRFAALDTGISFSEIFRGLYQDDDQKEKFYQRVNSSTSELPISVSDKIDVNISEIKAKAYKLKHRHGRLDCIILDYLQLVDGDSASNKTRENEVSKISRGCKLMAKELEVPVIILAQLNRDVDKRKGKDRYPQLSDFRETGAIEQDADVAIFLHSDFKSGHEMDDEGNSTEDKADIVIRKWRNGIPNLIIPLDFDGPSMRFTERNTQWKRVTDYSNENKF